MTIATKEHPAMIGAVPSDGLMALKRRYDHFAILPPSTNNYAVLRKAETIVTVNSKSGAEAGLIGKEVIVLGDVFYRNAPFAHAISALNELGAAIEEHSRGKRPAQNESATRAFFAALWQRTFPGELYVDSSENVRGFCQSLLAALDQHALGQEQAKQPSAFRMSA